jgi:hypothetical protein
MPCCPRALNVASQKLIRFCTLAGPQTRSMLIQSLILAAIDIYFLRPFESARFHVHARPWRGARPLARLSQPAGAHGGEGRRERKNAMWCRIVACLSLFDVW